ncbi:9189_t:CDS:2, partial [Gigaspora margarita]
TKKLKQLNEENVVVRYDSLGYPSYYLSIQTFISKFMSALILEAIYMAVYGTCYLKIVEALVQELTITVSNHNFLFGDSQKLVSLVYLIINLNESNKSIHDKQLAIFVRPQWYIGSISTTHMANIFALLAYNPVKRSMGTLLKKLVKITLPIDKHGTYLALQEKIQDIELGLHNFHYVKKRLCEL